MDTYYMPGTGRGDGETAMDEADDEVPTPRSWWYSEGRDAMGKLPRVIGV